MSACNHLDARCKASSRSWNSYRWCPACKKWFWYGEAKRDPGLDREDMVRGYGRKFVPLSSIDPHE